ncbi:MAG: hypothetical protein IJM59_10375 [Proteobacteria bacterium]|nr:hypothetical protein [Pseudomonadota bacterium]
MKTIRNTALLALSACLLFACDDGGSSNNSGCTSRSDCNADQFCSNGQCVPACTPTSCPEGQMCGSEGVCVAKTAEPECSDTKQCADANKVCVNGACVAKAADPQCSQQKPCTDPNTQCVNGACVPKGAEPECSQQKPCTDPNTQCVNGACVPKGSEPECSQQKPCADPSMECSSEGKCVAKASEPECSQQKPCADSSKECSSEGKCVPKASEPECSKTKPCADSSKECSSEGKCVDKAAEAECSDTKKCASPYQKCSEGKCVLKLDKSCTNRSDCDDGMICDNKKCIPENGCTSTHPCPDKKVCHGGLCVDNTISTCNKDKPCADKSKTCIAGKCVTCNCKADESCVGDGKCVKKDVSAKKSIKAGDTCTYTADFSFCEDNRYFSCSQGVGEATHTVKVKDCGADICTNSPSDGVNCYEPCDNEGDFFGECVAQYNSMTGKDEYAGVLSICTKGPEGNYWTFEDKNPYCSSTCTNGACDYIPDELASECNPSKYNGKCDGNWNLLCDSDDSYGGKSYVVGENCPKIYAEDYFCDVDEAGEAQCVKPCTKANETSFRCVTSSQKNYSDSLVCKKTKGGKLAWFMTKYEECSSTCNQTTGKCN